MSKDNFQMNNLETVKNDFYEIFNKRTELTDGRDKSYRRTKDGK